MSVEKKFRHLEFGVTRVALRQGAAGTHYLKAEQALGEYPQRLTDRLAHWARASPDRTLFARRTHQKWTARRLAAFNVCTSLA